MKIVHNILKYVGLPTVMVGAGFLVPFRVAAQIEGFEAVGVGEVALPSDQANVSPWEIALDLGSTGIGVEGAYRINPHWKARVGIAWTPPIGVPLNFHVMSIRDGAITEGNFEHLSELMEEVSGVEVDEKVEMRGKPKMFNGKVLVDYYPWADRGWHVTAGFYIGNRKVGTACNTMKEMPSLLALNIYNKAYEYFTTTDFTDTPIYGDDVYLDPEVADMLKEKFEQRGMMGIYVGDFKDGKPYVMYPNKEGMVRARAMANAVRPYLGVGYNGGLKNSPFTLGFDLGAMFWGGAPDIYTHDGVNLTKDMGHIRGNVGQWMDVIKALKVYPVLNFRVAYRF